MTHWVNAFGIKPDNQSLIHVRLTVLKNCLLQLFSDMPGCDTVHAQALTQSMQSNEAEV